MSEYLRKEEYTNMTSEKISQIIDSSFDAAFSSWSQKIEKDLYPAAFANEYSWLRVKCSIETNNFFLKETLKKSLVEILSSE